jgi:thiol-disulfide isomerase/thioredoxin
VTGLIALLAALAVTAAVAALVKARNGRFAAARRPDEERLSAADLGADLGARATLVQFSSAFCAPCRATRLVLADVAGMVDGVTTVDIDAEQHLALVRRLGIMRTPTVLVLDADGVVRTRASGLPRREQVLAALGGALDDAR